MPLAWRFCPLFGNSPNCNPEGRDTAGDIRHWLATYPLVGARNCWQVAAMNTQTVLTSEGVDFQQLARDKVMEWSALCRQFLDFQRREILLGHPTPQQLKAHRTMLKWMLRLTRSLHAS